MSKLIRVDNFLLLGRIYSRKYRIIMYTKTLIVAFVKRMLLFVTHIHLSQHIGKRRKLIEIIEQVNHNKRLKYVTYHGEVEIFLKPIQTVFQITNFQNPMLGTHVPVCRENLLI